MVGDASERHEQGPRRRLREARADRGLTPEQLATMIARAPSTIRAHENGQNRITAEMAEIYGEALGVGAEWLLWGRGDKASSSPQLKWSLPYREVPIVAELKPSIWIENFTADPINYIPVRSNDYAAVHLTAYIMGQRTAEFSQGDYLIVAPLELRLMSGDRIVVKTVRGDLTRFTLAEVRRNSAGTFVENLMGGLSSLMIRRAGEAPSGPRAGEKAFPVGIVVGAVGWTRGGAGPSFDPAPLDSLEWRT